MSLVCALDGYAQSIREMTYDDCFGQQHKLLKLESFAEHQKEQRLFDDFFLKLGLFQH